MSDKHIVSGSGGFQYIDGRMRFGPLVRYTIELSGKRRPRVAYLATAVGDNPQRISGFYNACSNEAVCASHLELFPSPNQQSIKEYLLSQDIIWVGGGSVVNLLAVWEAHKIGEMLKAAWNEGVILAGQSAGSICWFIGGTTDSFGMGVHPVTNGLGFLPYSNEVHYDSDVNRRQLFHQLIQKGDLPMGFAADDGVNLHFLNTELKDVISDLPGKKAYKVYRDDSGNVSEEVIEPRLIA